MILVTGGTGLVGAHLLWQLVQKHQVIRAIHRDEGNLKKVAKVFSYYGEHATEYFEKIEWIKADITDIPALEAAFSDIDYVYHAAALISFDPGDFGWLMKVNKEGTANIINLAIAHAVKKLCYVSTIGSIGRALNGAPANEESEWTPENTNVYAKSKYAAEMEVWRGAQEGLPVVMVNPGVILGPGFWDRGTGTLFQTAYKGYRFYPPGGTGFVSVHDVVRMMILLMDTEIVNQRYIAVAENLTYEEVLSRMCPLLGRSKPSHKLKFWQLEVGRIADILWSFLTGASRKVTRASIHSLKHRDDYCNRKAKEELHFEFEALDPVIEFSCARFMEEYP